MLCSSDNDPTLPAVALLGAGDYQPLALVATVSFHPNVQCIGCRAVFELSNTAARFVIGRSTPMFCRSHSGDSCTLDELHISREAVILDWHKGELCMQRSQGASRCMVESWELHDSHRFSKQQMLKGVSVLLGHSVVVILKLEAADSSLVSPDSCSRIIGHSRAMMQLKEQILKLARTESDVLLRGQTGVGKDLVAAALHANSSRRAQPLTVVNMAAIPSGLAASALFGTKKGAYTGSNKSQLGYFRSAHQGCLFLDEIGDTPLDIQPQLLRALQQREIQPVGGDVCKVDVRIFAATDAPVDAKANFKAALHHRLAATEIQVPALQEHIDDVGTLLMHYLGAAARVQAKIPLLPYPGMQATELGRWALLFHRLNQYAWPGNVRQLSNFCTQIITQCSDNLQLPAAVVEALSDIGRAGVDESCGNAQAVTMSSISDICFDEAMIRNDFEISAVARQLAVSRQAVYRRVQRSQCYQLAADVTESKLRQLFREERGDIDAITHRLKVSKSALRSRLHCLDEAVL